LRTGGAASKEDAVQDFRKLFVWQKAHRLTLQVYVETANLPPGRGWALESQLTRAATSVPANIAEGCGRAGDRDFRRFLRHSLGSACELEYHLLLARDLGFLPEPSYTRLGPQIVEIKRMLVGLIRRLATEPDSSGHSGRERGDERRG
jgi:four helix bundle protein